MTEFLLPALLATALAGLVRGFTGFGGALVMAPVLLTLTDPISTTAIVIIVNVVAGILQAREIHREADWGIARPLCYIALLTAPIGLWSIHVLDIERVRQIVGAVVLLATLTLLLRWRFPFSIRQPLGVAVLGGSPTSL
ncbi:MAG: TSUP family transporter [Gammaproteobacteria bacterium]|nr:TSUP family transporter [Gammaproteobacteria bacterium]